MEKDQQTEAYDIGSFGGQVLPGPDGEAVLRLKGTGEYLLIEALPDGGYVYAFYDREFRKLDGDFCDAPVSMRVAAKRILSAEKGLSLSDCEPVDSGAFSEIAERAEYFPRKAYEALKELMDSGAEEAAFRSGYGYVSIQKVPEGYEYIIYGEGWDEIGGDLYDDPDASLEEVVSWMFWKEEFGKLDTAPFPYGTVVKETLRAAKGRLSGDALTVTSQISRREAALDGYSRHDVEEAALYHAQSVIEEMGLDGDVKLSAARVYGSRLRGGPAAEHADIEVVLSYRGGIREEAFSRRLQEHGLETGGITIRIHPIAAEQTGTLKAYLEQEETRLDQKEREELAADIGAFAHGNGFYGSLDGGKDREQAVQEVLDALTDGRADALKSWLAETARGGEGPAAEARALFARMNAAEERELFAPPEQTGPAIAL